MAEFLTYHHESLRIGDVDPSNALLRYVCDRFELSDEQRLWCAWLYAMTYNGAAAFYLYNEFPDAENVDLGRLRRWWEARGRDETTFTTDRRWCRSSNQFAAAFESYRAWLGGLSQAERFAGLATGATASERYRQLFDAVMTLHTVGQFTAIIYLDVLDAITGLRLAPTDFDWNAAWSVRFGLYYAMGLDEHITDGYSPLPPALVEPTQAAWRELQAHLSPETTIANVETTLCAYRKFHRGKRYIGYYLDRQALEIGQMAAKVRTGVAWDVLWQFRAETYQPDVLVEASGLPLALATKGVPLPWRRRNQARTARAIGTTQAWGLT